jgi:uncharacterized protein (DUF58 family)
MNVTRTSDITITRRGKVALVVIALAVLMGWRFGSRSLNFVAAPALAALVAGALHVRRSGKPGVEFSEVDAGFPGEQRTLSVTVTGSGIATVKLVLPRGASEGQTAGEDVAAIDATVTLPHTFELQPTLGARGIYEIGPPTVRQRGALGLIERRVETTATTTLAVYPQRYGLAREGVVNRFFTDELETERQEFDRLREYTPEDPLRHIHWKTSAKHDEFLVMEFAPTQRTEVVTIAATAAPGQADEMARASATVADVALAAGLEVELVVPDGVLPPGQGRLHRQSLLRLLAGTGSGSIPDSVTAEADVAIDASETGTTLRIADRTYELADIVTDDRQTPGMEVVA